MWVTERRVWVLAFQFRYQHCVLNDKYYRITLFFSNVFIAGMFSFNHCKNHKLLKFTHQTLTSVHKPVYLKPNGPKPSFGCVHRQCCENMAMMTDERRRTEEWDKETDRRAHQRDSPSPLQRELSACCRHSGYKQKVFSPLTSSTGPSAGRRHRNAHYSQGVTATVCHQSVGLAALPRKTMPQQGHHSDSSWKEGWGGGKNKQAWWNIHIGVESHLISPCASME